MKCRICKHYMSGLDTCEFCHFEYCNEYFPCDDDNWDILKIDDDVEWSHLQIMDRLYFKKINCLAADMWFDNNIAYVIGAKADATRVAEALGVYEEVIYDDFEHGLMIINLYQEKALRNLLFDPTTYDRTRWLNEIREYFDDGRTDDSLMQLCICFTLQSLRNDSEALNKFWWKDGC